MTKRLVYLGTPAMAVPPLRALVDAGHDVRLVITRTDKRRGRGSDLQPSPVKAAALALGLSVSHELSDIAAAQAELGVVVAYGRIIPLDLLVPPLGVPMVNLHFSLLPRWRGAAPVERALLAGDTETGVCVMRVEEGLDTGAVHARSVVAIGPRDTADELRRRLVDEGSRLLVSTLAGDLPPAVPQVGEPVYAAKITPAELRIDWTDDCSSIDRLVRLGGAWTTFRDKRVKVLSTRLASSPTAVDDTVPSLAEPCSGLRVETVQPEGKGPMSVDDFCRGARPLSGERFE
jgi:methionyl-tRNA formyltransferase